MRSGLRATSSNSISSAPTPRSKASAWTEIAEETAAQAVDGLFSAAEYRDRSGIGRNLTIEVLEFLDAAHVTRRFGERRRILQTADEPSARQTLDSAAD